MWPGLERAWQLSCQGQVEAALALAAAPMPMRSQPTTSASVERAPNMGWYCFMLGYYEEGILHVLSARDFYGVIGDRPRESWTPAIHAWLLSEIGAPTRRWTRPCWRWSSPRQPPSRVPPALP